MYQNLERGQSCFCFHEPGCYIPMLGMVNVIAFALTQCSSGSLENNLVS